MPTIRQLRYLDALARFAHFGKAAEYCSVTQPALSTQIQELEAKLGVTLVERRAKVVALTDIGQEIARRAAHIIAAVRDLQDAAEQSQGGLGRSLRIGVIPTIGPYVLPRVLPVVRERYEGVDLSIRESQTHHLVDRLVDGTLDVLLLALPIIHSDVETHELFIDRFVLAVPPGRGERGRVKATPDVFQNDRLLLLEEGHCMRDQALAVCDLRRVEDIDTFGASSLTTIVQLVANGMGLTLLPEISLDIEADRGAVELVRFVEPQPSRTIGLAWRASSPRRADFLAFGDLVKETVGAAALSRAS